MSEFTVLLRQLQWGLSRSTGQGPRGVLAPSLLELAAKLEALPLSSTDRALTGRSEPARTLAQFHWRRAQVLPSELALTDLTAATRLFTELVIGGESDETVPAQLRNVINAVLEYTTEPHTVVGIVLAHLLYDLAAKTRDLTLISHALSVLERLLDDLPEAHAAREIVLSNLCVALKIRGGATGSTADMDRLIAVARELVSTTPHADRQWAEHAFTLTDSLRTRAARTGSLDDLNESIEVTATWSRLEGADAGAALFSLNGLLLVRYQQTGDPGDLDWAIDVGRSALRHLRGSSSARPEVLLKAIVNLAQALQLRLSRTRDAADLDETLTLWAEAIPQVPTDHPDYAAFRGNFGAALLDKFEATQDLALLDEALAAGRSAVAAENKPGKRREAFLAGLARSLERRFEKTGDAANLDELVAISREQLELTPSYATEYSGRLMVLAIRLNQRYDISHGETDLDEIIHRMREFAGLVVPNAPDYAAGMMLLCQTLRKRGGLADLNEAITNLTRQARTETGEHLTFTLIELSRTLRARAEVTSDLGDLDKTLDVLRKAANSAGGDYQTAILSELSVTSRLHFERSADQKSLESALDYGKRAVQASTQSGSQADSADAHQSLGAALSAMYQLTANVGDLEAAAKEFSVAISLAQAGNLLWTTAQTNLGHTLRLGFDNTGNLEYLDKAISALRSALGVPRDTSPDRAITMTNLAGALAARYRHFGAISDLDEAISFTKSATEISARGHRNLAMAYNALGGELFERFSVSRNRSDLEDAIGASRTAVECSPPDHPDLAFIQANLAAMLYERHKLSRERSDLDEAISVMSTSAEKSSTHSTDSMAYLVNLGLFMGKRFELFGDPSDLDAAINYERTASSALPADHPLQASVRSNLGALLADLFHHGGAESARDEALELLRDAAAVIAAPAETRLKAAWACGNLAAQSGLTEQAASTLSTAVELLPLAAWHGTARSDRERQLSSSQGLASNAAAWAITAGRPQQGVELLELGRTVLWNQVLHTQSDFADLRRQSPDLASALEAICAELARLELSVALTVPDR